MKLFLLIPVLTFAISGCAQGDSKIKDQGIKIGEPCEGCEAIHESPVPFDKLHWIDTLPGFHDGGPRLELSGTVFHKDGKTPAKDVVIYIYHTDQKGVYSTKGNETGWGKRHGYMRGWVKTNENGQYKFYTTRPASYPNSNNPQHIHPTIKEPGYNEYFIDEFLFADDPLLTNDQLKHAQNRGGNGVLKPALVNGMWIAKRDIVLGLNIPGYPSN